MMGSGAVNTGMVDLDRHESVDERPRSHSADEIGGMTPSSRVDSVARDTFAGGGSGLRVTPQVDQAQSDGLRVKKLEECHYIWSFTVDGQTFTIPPFYNEEDGRPIPMPESHWKKIEETYTAQLNSSELTVKPSKVSCMRFEDGKFKYLTHDHIWIALSRTDWTRFSQCTVCNIAPETQKLLDEIEEQKQDADNPIAKEVVLVMPKVSDEDYHGRTNRLELRGSHMMQTPLTFSAVVNTRYVSPPSSERWGKIHRAHTSFWAQQQRIRTRYGIDPHEPIGCLAIPKRFETGAGERWVLQRKISSVPNFRMGSADNETAYVVHISDAERDALFSGKTPSEDHLRLAESPVAACIYANRAKHYGARQPEYRQAHEERGEPLIITQYRSSALRRPGITEFRWCKSTCGEGHAPDPYREAGSTRKTSLIAERVFTARGTIRADQKRPLAFYHGSDFSSMHTVEGEEQFNKDPTSSSGASSYTVDPIFLEDIDFTSRKDVRDLTIRQTKTYRAIKLSHQRPGVAGVTIRESVCSAENAAKLKDGDLDASERESLEKRIFNSCLIRYLAAAQALDSNDSFVLHSLDADEANEIASRAQERAQRLLGDPTFTILRLTEIISDDLGFEPLELDVTLVPRVEPVDVGNITPSRRNRRSGSATITSTPSYIITSVQSARARRKAVSNLYATNAEASQFYRDEALCPLMGMLRGNANTGSGPNPVEVKIRENPGELFNSLRDDGDRYKAKVFARFAPIDGYRPSHRRARRKHGPDHARAVMELTPHIIDAYSSSALDQFSELDFDRIKSPEISGLIEIAVGLHDIARTTHGIDTDEYMNTPLTYWVLRENGCSHTEASLYSYAIANKDSGDCASFQANFDSVYTTLDDAELETLATKIGWDGTGDKKAYIKTFFELVCRTGGDADTLEICRVHSTFDTRFYSFYTENQDAAKRLLGIAKHNLVKGWPGYTHPRGSGERRAMQAKHIKVGHRSYAFDELATPPGGTIQMPAWATVV